MANFGQLGDSLIALGHKQVRGEPITYQQGTSTVSLTAWPGGVKEYEVSGESELLNEVASFDWTCEVADLGIEPRAGDRITREGGARYEVVPMGSRPCFEHFGTSGLMYLIHTKELQ